MTHAKTSDAVRRYVRSARSPDVPEFESATTSLCATASPARPRHAEEAACLQRMVRSGGAPVDEAAGREMARQRACPPGARQSLSPVVARLLPELPPDARPETLGTAESLTRLVLVF